MGEKFGKCLSFLSSPTNPSCEQEQFGGHFLLTPAMVSSSRKVTGHSGQLGRQQQGTA